MCDDTLLDVAPHSLSDAALAESSVALELLIRRAQAAQARAVRVFDARDAADGFGSPTATAWLRTHLGLSDRDARSLVALGRATDRFPALAASVADGAATADHLRVAAAAARTLDADTVADGDPLLATTARTLDSTRFAQVVDRWVARVAPAEHERDTEKRYDSRWLSVAPTWAGMHSIRGMLDPEAGTLLHTALAALVTANPAGDARTRDQQRADALADLTRAALTTTHLPGAVQPEIVVHLTADTAATLPTPDPHLPALGRMPADPAPPAELTDTGPIPNVTLRRLACDARFRRLVLDPAGIPTDLGRTTRTIPTGLRKLIALRDQGCRYPGCTRSPAHCDAHHAVHWADGGTTDPANLVLLCRYHHHLVHERHHHLKLRPDATVEVTTPTGHVLTSHPPQPHPRL